MQLSLHKTHNQRQSSTMPVFLLVKSCVARLGATWTGIVGHACNVFMKKKSFVRADKLDGDFSDESLSEKEHICVQMLAVYCILNLYFCLSYGFCFAATVVEVKIHLL